MYIENAIIRKTMYGLLVQSLLKFQWHFLQKKKKNDSKICMEPQKIPDTKAILREKE